MADGAASNPRGGRGKGMGMESGRHGPEPRMPAGFLWGAATAAHQVEGWNVDSDWWAAEQAGLVPTASGAACLHRERFEQDLELLVGAGLNAYRFSVEWARLEPQPGVWRPEELAAYVHMAQRCRERGVRPLVTLYHFSLPRWLAERGGWLWSGAVPAFAAYVERVAAAMGDRVDLYATVNEPVILALQAYLHGMWPPKARNPAKALAVFRRLGAAHRAAYEVLHERAPGAAVGVAHHVIDFRPLAARHPGDRAMARMVSWLFNDAWLETTRDRLDWVGMNYYTTHYCSTGLRPGRLLPEIVRARERPQTEMGWEIHPEGLGQALGIVARLGLPVYVTENGVATPNDQLRCHFLRTHLLAAAEAIAGGVDLRGYFHWSLLDNFEWAEGYSMHFGLVGVERETLEREPHPSLRYLGAMARANAVLAGGAAWAG